MASPLQSRYLRTSIPIKPYNRLSLRGEVQGQHPMVTLLYGPKNRGNRNVHEALRRFEFRDNNDPDGQKTEILENPLWLSKGFHEFADRTGPILRGPHKNILGRILHGPQEEASHHGHPSQLRSLTLCRRLLLWRHRYSLCLQRYYGHHGHLRWPHLSATL
jgi:hypothetical protein